MLTVLLQRKRRIGLIFAAVTVPLAVAAADPCPREIGRWPYGIASAVASNGDLYYVGVGNVLRTVRFDQPDALTTLSELVLPETPWDIVPTGTMLAVANGVSGLQLVDVQDPENPAVIGESRIGGTAVDVAVANGIAWVAVGRGGVRGVDISDPASPTVVAAFRPAVVTYGVAVSGTTLWLATNEGLHSLDIGNPARPTAIGKADFISGVDLTIVADLAYVAAAWNGLAIFDISDPARPEFVGAWADFNSASVDVVVDGSIAYLADIDLAVIDVSDPTSPVIIARYSTSGVWPIGLGLQDDRLAVAGDAGGLHVLDVTEPGEPVLAAHMETPGSHRAIAVVGDLAVLASNGDEAGLRTIDLSDPENPSLAGSADGPDYTSYVDVVVLADHAYVMDSIDGFYVFDLADPANPNFLIAHEVIGGMHGADSWDGQLVTAAYRDGLILFDVSQPQSPVETWRIDSLRNATDLVVVDDLAYVVWESGLAVVDLGAPGGPEVIGEAPGTSARAIDVSGSVAVAAGGWKGLLVYDVSDPTRPSEVARRETGDCGHVVALGDRAVTWEYRRSSCDTITVFDISTPEQPVELGRRCISTATLARNDSSILAVERYGGLRVLDLSACELPNPRESGLAKPGIE